MLSEGCAVRSRRCSRSERACRGGTRQPRVPPSSSGSERPRRRLALRNRRETTAIPARDSTRRVPSRSESVARISSWSRHAAARAGARSPGRRPGRRPVRERAGARNLAAAASSSRCPWPLSAPPPPPRAANRRPCRPPRSASCRVARPHDALAGDMGRGDRRATTATTTSAGSRRRSQISLNNVSWITTGVTALLLASLPLRCLRGREGGRRQSPLTYADELPSSSGVFAPRGSTRRTSEWAATIVSPRAWRSGGVTAVARPCCSSSLVPRPRAEAMAWRARAPGSVPRARRDAGSLDVRPRPGTDPGMDLSLSWSF